MHLGLTAGGQKEVEGALDLAGDRVAYGVDDLRDLARHRRGPRDHALALEVFGLLERYVELALDLLGDVVPTVGDIAGKSAGATRDDVDGGETGTNVDDREGL